MEVDVACESVDVFMFLAVFVLAPSAQAAGFGDLTSLSLSPSRNLPRELGRIVARNYNHNVG
jgi:hypothetical protein